MKIITINVLKPKIVYGWALYAILMILVGMDQMNYIVMVSVLQSCQLFNQFTESKKIVTILTLILKQFY